MRQANFFRPWRLLALPRLRERSKCGVHCSGATQSSGHNRRFWDSAFNDLFKYLQQTSRHWVPVLLLSPFLGLGTDAVNCIFRVVHGRKSDFLASAALFQALQPSAIRTTLTHAATLGTGGGNPKKAALHKLLKTRFLRHAMCQRRAGIQAMDKDTASHARMDMPR